MKASTVLWVVVVALACSASWGLLGCKTSGEKGEPQPNPDGVLLEGDPAAPALNALVELPPSPVGEDEILENRLLTTRLVAALNPDVTVGAVNEALETAGSRIVSMLPEHLYLTLKVPAVTSPAEAESVAEKLRSTGAFLSVFADYDFLPNTVDIESDLASVKSKVLPPAPNQPLQHLEASRMYAAWHAKELAPGINLPIAVVVPDWYLADLPHPEIDAQIFVEAGGQPTSRVSDGKFAGNHGYHVCGIVGANYDDTDSTGVMPDPARLLDLRSLHEAGLGLRDTLHAYSKVYSKRFPWGDAFVVNSSLGWDDDWIDAHPMEILELTLAWREIIAPYSDLFLHVVAAGNYGRQGGDVSNAHYIYFPATAHFFEDLRNQIPATGILDTQEAAFRTAWDHITARVPEAAKALDNVLVVGSSNPFGAEHAFSNDNSEVRAVGERVLGPCWQRDPEFDSRPHLCDDNVARYSGTSYATPQISGLAAYLWTLDPSLSVKRVRDAIVLAFQNSPTPGIVDAYLAVLSIDLPWDWKVRRAIMDVAGDTPAPGSNGRFDENDIELFMQQLQSWDGVTRAYDRYDLNGDGFTAPHDLVEAFDLTADDPPAWTTVSVFVEARKVDFDETQLTDCEILRYYAYAGLYEGDWNRRTALLLGCEQVDWPSFANVSVRIDVDATMTDDTGASIHQPMFSTGSSAEGTGLDSAGNFNFVINEDYVFDFSTRSHRGSIIGKLDPDEGVIESLSLDVTITHIPSIGSQSTEDLFVQLANVPATHATYDWYMFEIKGPVVCSHIVGDIEYDWSHPDGGHELTSFACNDTSWIHIGLGR